MTTNLITRVELVLIAIFITIASSVVYGCDLKTDDKGVTIKMKTYYIGRFTVTVPTEMELKIRSSKLRYVDIKEIIWPKDINPEQARTSEWDRFLANTQKLTPPDGANKVIIRTNDFPGIGKWATGMFYHDENFSNRIGTWTFLMNAGATGVWFKSDPLVVLKELTTPKTEPNIINIAKAYQAPETVKPKGQHPDNYFYLQYGAINLPYSAQEESIARFEGHPQITKLLIEMEMDMNHEIEPQALIKGTKAMLAAALVTPNGGISKIRLGKREVAGMPGEEAVLKVKEGNRTDLVFTWEFNGKDDSGEYPTTRINMESPDGNLDEKLKIWDAVLDSMKPMFARKK